MEQSPPTPRTYYVARSYSLSLSLCFLIFLSHKLKALSLSSPSFFSFFLPVVSRFCNSTFYRYGICNIVIFPRAMHFCAPPRALRSFRPICIRIPCDLELEITQVHHRLDGCLGDLDHPGSFSNCNAPVAITSDYNPNWRLNVCGNACFFEILQYTYV